MNCLNRLLKKKILNNNKFKYFIFRFYILIKNKKQQEQRIQELKI